MLRWMDGFDYYADADLTSLYNIVNTGPGYWRVTPGAGRFGSGALVNDVSGGSQPVAKFFDNQPTWVVGFAYKFSVAGVANLICMITDIGVGQVELRMNASNQLVITRNGTVLATGTTSLFTNTYYYLEFKVTIAASISAGSCKARLNGSDEVVVATASNTNNSGNAYANRVVLWYDNFTIKNWFDDFYVLDGTGSSNNDFLGDMRIEAITPTANGTYSEWSVNTGTHFGAVSESNEDGDTSYIYSSTVGQRDTFAMSDLSSSPSSIAGIKMTAVSRKDDAGTRGVTPMIRMSGTDYLGVERGLGDTYQYSTAIFEKNPATAGVWTGATVNAIEAGWKVTT